MVCPDPALVYLKEIYVGGIPKTSRKTFQNISSELFRLIPGNRLPFLPRRKFKAQSRKVCKMAMDSFRNSCSGSLRR
jgi:hypothetical protein